MPTQQIALHFNGRPKDYKIVLNSATPKGDKLHWNKELYLAWPGSFTVGDKFDIVVVVEDGHFRFKVSQI